MLRSSDIVCRSFPLGLGRREDRPSAHFLDRFDTHYCQTGSNYHSRRRHQRKARQCLRRLIRLQESERRVVLASVPQHMKVGRQVIEKKRYPMWFPCDCGGFNPEER